jgi:two-component system, NtrC family, sensor kinase
MNDNLNQSAAINLSDLTALVTHDFNNCLNGIFLRLALLEQEFPAAREELRAIRDLGDEAAGLIRRLQQFNRPATRAVEPVDINATIHELVHALSTSQTSIPRMEMELSEECPRPIVNAHDFRRLIGLILAHCTAVSGSDGTIRVRTDRAGPRAIVEIEDTGPSIPEDQLHRVFDPFVTLREGADENALAVCRLLTRRLRGDIKAVNRPDRGVIFRVELSAARD